MTWDLSEGHPIEVHPADLRPPLHAPPASDTYTWLIGGNALAPPARWSPCTPIHVQVNPTGFDGPARAAIRWALTELQTRTGLRVLLDPDTDERVTGPLRSRTWSRDTWDFTWRRTWQPVLVMASDSDHTPELAGPVVGFTHDYTFGIGPWRRIVSGIVALDLEGIRYRGDPASQRALRMLLLHELGHVVGLADAKDDNLVMNPDTELGYGEAVTYRLGDLRGLAAAGNGRC